jgi:fused signal recognition particle receptor
VVIPIQQRLGVPVLYVGVGESLEDLEPFDPEAFVEGLLGR